MEKNSKTSERHIRDIGIIIAAAVIVYIYI